MNRQQEKINRIKEKLQRVWDKKIISPTEEGWEERFRDQFSIKVTPYNEQDTTSAFLMERFWQEHPIGEMVDFIAKELEKSRTDTLQSVREKFLKIINSELAQAHTDSEKTSRLTSLYNKFIDLLSTLEPKK